MVNIGLRGADLIRKLKQENEELRHELELTKARLRDHQRYIYIPEINKVPEPELTAEQIKEIRESMKEVVFVGKER